MRSNFEQASAFFKRKIRRRTQAGKFFADDVRDIYQNEQEALIDKHKCVKMERSLQVLFFLCTLVTFTTPLYNKEWNRTHFHLWGAFAVACIFAALFARSTYRAQKIIKDVRENTANNAKDVIIPDKLLARYAGYFSKKIGYRRSTEHGDGVVDDELILNAFKGQDITLADLYEQARSNTRVLKWVESTLAFILLPVIYQQVSANMPTIFPLDPCPWTHIFGPDSCEVSFWAITAIPLLATSRHCRRVLKAALDTVEARIEVNIERKSDPVAEYHLQ